MMSSLIAIIITSAVFNNVILGQFLGDCAFLGVSKAISTAWGMGLAVIFVMVLANAITFFVQLLLVKAGVAYLQTLAFILVIAALCLAATLLAFALPKGRTVTGVSDA